MQAPNPSRAEEAIVTLAVAGLFITAIVRAVEYVRTANAKPDPWDGSVEAAIHEWDATPVCTRCLQPHGRDEWFCPDCGAPVGPFVMWMPYLQSLALGDLLRHGTLGRYRVTKLAVLGYAFLGACQYMLFAPIFWWSLGRNILRLSSDERHPPANSEETKAPPQSPPG